MARDRRRVFEEEEGTLRAWLEGSPQNLGGTLNGVFEEEEGTLRAWLEGSPQNLGGTLNGTLNGSTLNALNGTHP